MLNYHSLHDGARRALNISRLVYIFFLFSSQSYLNILVSACVRMREGSTFLEKKGKAFAFPMLRPTIE